MLFGEYISEPNAKIVSVDYSWADTSKPQTSWERAKWFESFNYNNLRVTIKTQNATNGTTINMNVRAGYNNVTSFTGQVK